MNLKEQLAALQKELLGMQAKAQSEGRDFTDEELTEIEAKGAEITALKTRIERIEASEKSLKALIEFGKSDDDAEDNPDDFKSVPLGERFTKSGAYAEFAKANPSGVGQGSPVKIDRVRIGTMKEFFANRKAAIDTGDARIQNIRVPMVDQIDRPTLTLLDLISRGETGGNFEYVQVVSVERNASIVKENTGGEGDQLKPTSELTTALADAKVYTYADGYDVTNQLLADAPAFASYMDQELRYSLDALIEDKLLNGSGVSGEPKGILHTTGVQDHEFVGTAPIDFVKGVRRAITKVTRLGGSVQAILVSPEDDEEIDLMQDAQGRFFSSGPFGAGVPTLWGRARVTSEKIEPGTFLLGDFKQVALLDREGLSVLAFNQHKDYAQRNLTYVRAELRAAQVIWKPNRLVFGHRGSVES